MKIYTILVKDKDGTSHAYGKAFKKKEDAFEAIEIYSYKRGYCEVKMVDTFNDKCTKVIYASRLYPQHEIVFNIIEVEVIE